jgi:hypothetical protein
MQTPPDMVSAAPVFLDRSRDVERVERKAEDMGLTGRAVMRRYSTSLRGSRATSEQPSNAS